MYEHLSDVLFLAVFCGVLFTAAGVGLLAIPWTDDELHETNEAFRAGMNWLDQIMHHTGQRVARRVDPAHVAAEVGTNPHTRAY